MIRAKENITRRQVHIGLKHNMQDLRINSFYENFNFVLEFPSSQSNKGD